MEWKAELKDYTARHRGVGGKPLSNPTFWLLYWTRPQVQARSHPEILKAMSAVMTLWHINDTSLPIDMDSQVVYADRFRIRRAGDKEYSLKAHLDSSAIERWEGEKYRSNYEAIFNGEWEKFDPWLMDHRPDAVTDLYQQQGACSAFRAMQGWLSMSNCGPGEGTLRLLPSLKLVMAYIMLTRSFRMGSWMFLSRRFRGRRRAKDSFFPRTSFIRICCWRRVLLVCRRCGRGIICFVSDVLSSKVMSADVRAGHCDLVHEVEAQHSGTEDSSVFYNASIPLCPYNIGNMLRMRKSFRDVEPPQDFYRDFGGPFEMEKEQEDHGAREVNILSVEGRRAIGLESFDETEPGLSEGQKKVRRIANEVMRE